MLDAGEPAVDVMTEYVRACRHLGHPAPEPASLRAAYTAEHGVDLAALDADHRALAEAVVAAEEALVVQDLARRTLVTAWRGAGADAAADHLMRHAQAAADAVEGLRGAATAVAELRNRLWQLIDDKVVATQGIEARGMRAEWLAAARTVTTGTGDRSTASELVDLQVAPFVAGDVGVDWVSSMRDTESAVRQAYRDAAAMAGENPVVFDRPGVFGVAPVAAERVSAPAAPAPAVTVPTGLAAAPAAVDPVSAPPPTGTAAPPAALPAPSADRPPAAVPAVAPMSPVGGLGGGAPSLGSGMSGLSGLGQSFADMLGGLLGSGGDGLGESLGDADNLDEMEPVELPDDEDLDEDLDEEIDAKDEDEQDELDEPADGEEPIEGPVEPAEDVPPPDPVAPQPEPAPTPVPAPPAEPLMVAPVAPDQPETPCEIAADALPQAGP